MVPDMPVVAATSTRLTLACSRSLLDHFTTVEILTRLPHG